MWGQAGKKMLSLVKKIPGVGLGFELYNLSQKKPEIKTTQLKYLQLCDSKFDNCDKYKLKYKLILCLPEGVSIFDEEGKWNIYSSHTDGLKRSHTPQIFHIKPRNIQYKGDWIKSRTYWWW